MQCLIHREGISRGDASNLCTRLHIVHILSCCENRIGRGMLQRNNSCHYLGHAGGIQFGKAILRVQYLLPAQVGQYSSRGVCKSQIYIISILFHHTESGGKCTAPSGCERRHGSDAEGAVIHLRLVWHGITIPTSGDR